MYESNQDPINQHGIGLNAKQGQTKLQPLCTIFPVLLAL